MHLCGFWVAQLMSDFPPKKVRATYFTAKKKNVWKVEIFDISMKLKPEGCEPSTKTKDVH